LAGLVKQLDAMVAAQQEKKLAAVLNIVGEANDEMKAKIKSFGEKGGLKKIPLVATTEGGKFKVNAEAEVTVMLYRGKKVKFNFALAKGELDAKTIAAIVDSTDKMLAMPEEPPEKPKEKPKTKPGDKPKAKEPGKPSAKK
jgi:hypothetical protein